MTPSNCNAAIGKGSDRTPWPVELMHAELCAWRFGGDCDCGKEASPDAE